MSSITAKELAMYIEPLREFEGCTFGWWVKGHYGKETFLAAVDEYEGGIGRAYETDADTYSQEYWRCVPVMEGGDYGGMMFHDAKPGTKGAFPVTCCKYGKSLIKFRSHPTIENNR